MNKILITAIALSVAVLFPIKAAAQGVPDNDRIKAYTTDPDSPFFYDNLLMRYKAGDATLTPEEYHYLYYGYAFRDEYDPLVPIPAEANILAVFDRAEEPDYSGMSEILQNAMEVMRYDPFSPSNLNFLIYAYGAIGDTVNERINYERFVNIIRVIEASGDGLREKTPMHIIRFSHATDFLASRGLAAAKSIVISKSVEFVELTQKDGDNRGYFFDYGRVYWKKPSREPEEEKRTWQFNNLPPKEYK